MEVEGGGGQCEDRCCSRSLPKARRDFRLCQLAQAASLPTPQHHSLCTEGVPRAGPCVTARETHVKNLMQAEHSLDSCGLSPATNHRALPTLSFFIPGLGQTLAFTLTVVMTLRYFPTFTWETLPLSSQGLRPSQLPAKFPLKFCGVGGRASEVKAMVLPAYDLLEGAASSTNHKEAEVLSLPPGVRHCNGMYRALCCGIHTICLICKATLGNGSIPSLKMRRQVRTPSRPIRG